MKELTKEYFDKITDCFTCADGGITFLTLATIIETLEEEAESGSAPSKRIIDLVHQFGRLVIQAGMIGRRVE